MAQDPSAGFLYTADTGGRVMRWQSDRPEKGYNVIWSGDKVIEAMTVSPDAAWLACGTATSEIIMIPLTGDMLSYQIEAGGGKVTALVFITERVTAFTHQPPEGLLQSGILKRTLPQRWITTTR